MSPQQEVSRLMRSELFARELLKLRPVNKVWTFTNPNYGRHEVAILVAVNDPLIGEYFDRMTRPRLHDHRQTRIGEAPSAQLWHENRKNITWDLLGTSLEAFLVDAFCQVDPLNLAEMQVLAQAIRRDSGNDDMSIVFVPNDWLNSISILTTMLQAQGPHITDPLDPITYVAARTTYVPFNPDTESFE
ncbi:hypothetical protein HJC99_04685 [Candidatus Saccharibacteria bacterium]|nr:hypothetical protein [Candidatus Saccharibacteria bacterium]